MEASIELSSKVYSSTVQFIYNVVQSTNKRDVSFNRRPTSTTMGARGRSLHDQMILIKTHGNRRGDLVIRSQWH